MDVAGTATIEDDRRTTLKEWFTATLGSYVVIILTIVVIVVFTLLPATSSTFFSVANMQAVLANQSVLLLTTLGLLIPLTYNQFDLSVGANVGMSAIVAASVFVAGGGLLLGVAAGIGCGVLIGGVNGILITRLKVNGVIVTLGVSITLQGLALWRTDGIAIVQGISPYLVAFGGRRTLSIPNIFWVALLLTIAVWYLLEHTPFGRYLYAVGSNKRAATLVGINTRRLELQGFLLGGALCGGAGVLLIASTGSASPHIGDTYTLPAFAAAFLSAAVILPGRFNAIGCLVAILFLAAVNSGLNLAGVPPFTQYLVNGVALVAGVALSGFFGRLKAGGETDS